MPTSNIRQVRLTWTGEGLSFEGGPDNGIQIGVDSDGVAGQTPMQLLLLSLATMRPPEALEVVLPGKG